MPWALPCAIILRYPSSDVAIRHPWAIASLVLVLAAQSLACIVIAVTLTVEIDLSPLIPFAHSPRPLDLALPLKPLATHLLGRGNTPGIRTRGSLTEQGASGGAEAVEDDSGSLLPLAGVEARGENDSVSATSAAISAAAAPQRNPDVSQALVAPGPSSLSTVSFLSSTLPQEAALHPPTNWPFPEGFVSFSTLLAASRSDKKVHDYGHMYAEYLDPLRLSQQRVDMMEIGVRDGDSLHLWLSAFPGGKIYGLEYNPKPMKRFSVNGRVSERVAVFRGDQANATLLMEIAERVRGESGPLDLIVDDGGHTMHQQMTSFTHLFPLLKPGGLYFIEDLQTSYWRNKCYHYWDMRTYCYGGGRVGKKNTTIDLLKSLIDVLNADFIMDHVDVNKLGSGIYSVNPSDSLVGSLQCWRNMCVIKRKLGEFF